MESQRKNTLVRTIEGRFGIINKTDQNNIEINIIRWNNGPKKLDIRMWSVDGRYPQKGITLDREEFLLFMDILNNINPMLIDMKKGSDQHEYEGDIKENEAENIQDAQEPFMSPESDAACDYMETDEGEQAS